MDGYWKWNVEKLVKIIEICRHRIKRLTVGGKETIITIMNEIISEGYS